MTSEFEYLLNAMENAGAQDDPHLHGYGDKRKAVLAYVAKLEAPRSPAQPDAVELLRELVAIQDAAEHLSTAFQSHEMGPDEFSRKAIANRERIALAWSAARAFLKASHG